MCMATSPEVRVSRDRKNSRLSRKNQIDKVAITSALPGVHVVVGVACEFVEYPGQAKPPRCPVTNVRETFCLRFRGPRIAAADFVTFAVYASM
ncbi:hypothetical protein BJ956_001548 [Arthrobacter psychrochitiniphilus]|nr:hypothetical protein [Arthrobacter psychrochitiniphilus]